MSNEITINGSLTGFKPSIMSGAMSRSIINLLFNMNSNYAEQGTYLAPITTAGALPIGLITTPHWLYLRNMDSTNYVTLRNGVSGADVGKFYPGEPCLFPFNDAGTPYLLANVAACLVEYLIFGT